MNEGNADLSEEFRLSPAQGLQIMAIGVMLRDGELTLDGDEAATARDALIDASQEIALQIKTGE